MTQKQLAEYLGVHQTTYSDYELGRLNIPLRTLCSIADFYGVSTDYLLRRTSNPEPYERRERRQEQYFSSAYLLHVLVG